jgi:hypothetical protein
MTLSRLSDAVCVRDLALRSPCCCAFPATLSATTTTTLLLSLLYARCATSEGGRRVDLDGERWTRWLVCVCVLANVGGFGL